MVKNLRHVLAVLPPKGIFFGNPTTADAGIVETLYAWVHDSCDPKSTLYPVEQKFRWKFQSVGVDGLPELEEPAPKKRGKAAKAKDKSKEKESTKRQYKSKETVVETDEENTPSTRPEPPATRNTTSRTTPAASTAPAPAPDSDDVQEYVPEGEQLAQRIQQAQGKVYVPAGRSTPINAASTSSSAGPSTNSTSADTTTPIATDSVATSTSTSNPIPTPSGGLASRRGLRVRVRGDQLVTQLISLEPAVARPPPEYLPAVSYWIL